ncbi:hypothetical protein [Thalassolituus pacificus]|uniref:Uncharacterized protein n=1 Tax=Thalassolituus pacificus TaxID=2975440 RepID=A0A9X2WHE4_9GAMM|nr:hypothetical protein [Thalassolituus pacificus]MCT7360504.1 hypothetical protein [Thalassolituus pacificus]
MSQALPVKQAEIQYGEISTILSEKVMIPISCDHCRQDTDVSIETLKSKHGILCEHCSHVRTFSATEMRLMRMLLAQAGYHFAL